MADYYISRNILGSRTQKEKEREGNREKPRKYNKSKVEERKERKRNDRKTNEGWKKGKK